MNPIMTKLAPEGFFIMGDIGDDSWFHDYVEREKRPFLVLDK